MAQFTDHDGVEWPLAFDAFNLDDIRDQVGIDLADLSASGWYQLASREPTLAKTLAILCPDQDARSLSGDDFPNALAALEAAAVDFFPPKKWSEMRTNLQTQNQAMQGMEAAKMLDKALPLAEAFCRLPEAMQAEIVREHGGDNSDLQRLRGLASASGLAATQSKPATDSQASAEELQPAV